MDIKDEIESRAEMICRDYDNGICKDSKTACSWCECPLKMQMQEIAKFAVKEFAEKATKQIHEKLDLENDYTPSMICSDIFDNLIKELYGNNER